MAGRAQWRFGIITVGLQMASELKQAKWWREWTTTKIQNFSLYFVI